MRERLRIRIRGAVQGVGFRPFVFRTATELHLTGFVQNDTAGVVVEAEGTRPALEELLARLAREAPPRAVLQAVTHSWIDPTGDATFEIRLSDVEGERTARRAARHRHLPGVPRGGARPGRPAVPLSLHELHELRSALHHPPRPALRPAQHHDGGLRPCAPRCQAEYDDPGDRRFHAQPNACPACGPQPRALGSGRGHARDGETTRSAAPPRPIGAGRIVAAEGARRLPPDGGRAQRGGRRAAAGPQAPPRRSPSP